MLEDQSPMFRIVCWWCIKTFFVFLIAETSVLVRNGLVELSTISSDFSTLTAPTGVVRKESTLQFTNRHECYLPNYEDGEMSSIICFNVNSSPQDPHCIKAQSFGILSI